MELSFLESRDLLYLWEALLTAEHYHRKSVEALSQAGSEEIISYLVEYHRERAIEFERIRTALEHFTG